MRYIKNGTVGVDPFVYVADGEPVPADAPAIVSADWLLTAPKEQIQGRTAPLGVKWPNNKPDNELAAFLPHLALVALDFPVFRDGRAFSQARLLRERYNFKGEVRATGDVLRDQFLFMLRSGFDAFEVRKDADADAFGQALREFTLRYQPAADGPLHSFRTRLATPLKEKDGNA